MQARAAEFIAKTEQGYAATTLGQQVYAQLVPLGKIAKAWSKALRASEA